MCIRDSLGFWWLAAGGKGAFGGLLLPALDWGFVAITAPTPVDGALLAACLLYTSRCV